MYVVSLAREYCDLCMWPVWPRSAVTDVCGQFGDGPISAGSRSVRSVRSGSHPVHTHLEVSIRAGLWAAIPFRYIWRVFKQILGAPGSPKVFQTYFWCFQTHIGCPRVPEGVSNTFWAFSHTCWVPRDPEGVSDTFWAVSNTFRVPEIFQTHWARGRVQNALGEACYGPARFCWGGLRSLLE